MSEEKPPMQRCILSEQDQDRFQESVAYRDIVKFVGLINDSVKYLRCQDVDDSKALSAPVKEILRALDEMYAWVDEITPVEQPMRFGNKSFRTWHSRLGDKAITFVENLLAATAEPWDKLPLETDKNEELCRRCKSFEEDTALKQHVISLQRDHVDEDTLCAELCAYLSDSFGNATRIDYGTGHETNFFIFLLGLYRVGVLTPNDLPILGLKVYSRYLRTARRLQVDYMLEPAGSHGVWSLDDYQMLVFLFGSSQLVGHDALEPSSIHSPEALETYKEDYLYFGAISFIHQVKHGGPFAEHSPILNDVSALPTWKKVNMGMQRMYRAEVLGKKPITQHILFGKLLQCDWEPSTSASQYYGSAFASSTNPGGFSAAAGGDVAPWAKSVPTHRSETLPGGGVQSVAPWAQPAEDSPIQVAQNAMKDHRKHRASSTDK
eukprot:gb/GECG01015458.1/.p1 GENE.gb/GECG01015458.1/~~gb/GECG01015458.1/.p1  ORF type:complete len:435 (+),score=48.91 gb/GECG01015458.1/:1-1305(+)